MKKFRVAIIGRTGHGDYAHGLDVAWLEVPEAEIVAVADDNPKGLAAAAKRLKTERTFADYRKMLDEMRPDIVAITQRWIDTHHEMAMACLERGIHVYLEKPFCSTLAQADELVAICKHTQAKLAIAHQTRYSPRLTVAQQLVADGKIGKILEYRCRAKEDHRTGSEELWVHGTHLFGLIRNFSPPATWCYGVVTRQGRPINRADIGPGNEGLGAIAGDDVHAMYGLGDGSTAYFSCLRNAGQKGSRFGLQIFGTAGVLEILTGHMEPSVQLLEDPSWSPARSGKAWVPVTTAGFGKPEPIADRKLHGGNLLAIADLLAAIRENRDPLASVYEARDATEMIVAVFESQRQGRPVALPLQSRVNPFERWES